MLLERTILGKKTKLFGQHNNKQLEPSRWATDIPYIETPSLVCLKVEGQIKCFSDKVKLKEFIITKPLLYEMLKGLI